MLPLSLIGMQGSNVHVSRTTQRPFTYTICLTLLLFPWRHGLVANTRLYDVQTCTLKQSNGSAFIGIKFLTAHFFFFLGGRTIKPIWCSWGKGRKAGRRVRWMSKWVIGGWRDREGRVNDQATWVGGKTTGWMSFQVRQLPHECCARMTMKFSGAGLVLTRRMFLSHVRLLLTF